MDRKRMLPAEKKEKANMAEPSRKIAKAQEKYPEEGPWSRLSPSATSSESVDPEPKRKKPKRKTVTVKVDVGEDKLGTLEEKIDNLTGAIERLTDVIQLSQYSWKDNTEFN